MTRYIQLFSFILLLAFSGTCRAAEEIPWATNYDQAVELSKKEQKPLFLYFTGSDWCGWCWKMDKEILSTSDLIDAVKNKFIFVKIDFPIYTNLDTKVAQQN